MTRTQRSPARFIVFLVVMAALVGYIVVKWGSFHEQTTALSDWETSPVVVVPGSETGDDQPEAPAEGEAADEPALPALSTGDGGAGNDGEAAATSGSEVQAVPDAAFFASSRMERERARSERIELLKALIDSAQVDPEARREAEQELIELSRRITQEAEIESLVRARGFEEVLVYLYDDSSVVIVQAEQLTEAQAAQIADAVVKVAGVPYPGISVMARPH